MAGNPGKAVWSLVQEENEQLRAQITSLSRELERHKTYLRISLGESEMLAKLRADHEAAVAALREAEACMSMVEPRSDKAEYLRVLGVVRAALNHNWSSPPDASPRT